MVHSHLILNWYHCSVHQKRGPGDKTRSSMPLLQFYYSPISYHYIALSRTTLKKLLIDWSYHNNQTKYEVIISREQLLALCEFYKFKPGGGGVRESILTTLFVFSSAKWRKTRRSLCFKVDNASTFTCDYNLGWLTKAVTYFQFTGTNNKSAK